MDKKCNICNEIKSLDHFYKDPRGYHVYLCKPCWIKRVSDATDKEAKAKYDKIYRQKRKLEIAKYKVQWYEKNKENLKEKKENNKEKVLLTKRTYEKNRKAKDPLYKLLCSLRSRVSSVLRGRFKPGSAVKDLGCTATELKIHIESKFYPHPSTGELMCWENHGEGCGKWQIDHIIALSLVNLSNKTEFLKVCHYTNLQPLWHEDHNLKTNNDRLLIRSMSSSKK